MKTLLKYLLRFHDAGDAGGGAGGGGGGDGGAGGGAGGLPAVVDLRTHMADDGAFKPGWSKALGVPDTLEAKFTRPEALARSYVSLEKQIGAKGVIIPGTNASQAERDAYFTALGRPAKPEEYGFKKPEKIGDRAVPDAAWDPKRVESFSKVAFEIGLTKAQAERLTQYSLEDGLTGADAIQRSQAEYQAKAKADLKTAWGADYDKNLGAAHRAAQQFGDAELMAHPAIGNDPVLLKFMAKVGAATGERPPAGRGEQGGDRGMSPADAKAASHKLTQEINARVKADRNWASSSEAQEMKARKSALFKMAYPEG